MRLPVFVLLSWTVLSWIALTSNAIAADSIAARPLATRDSASSATLFVPLTATETGVDFVQPIDTNHPNKCLYVGGYASPGVAIGDLNGDQRPDLVITGGPVHNRLYVQATAETPVGEGAAADQPNDIRFNDVTSTSGFSSGDAWSAGVTLVDIDNDGDLDIYVCNYDAANQLFVNETTSADQVRFVERAAQYGLDLIDASFNAAFADYDLDGDVDVFLSAYQYVNPQGRPRDLPVTKTDGKYIVLPEFEKYYGVVRGPQGQPTFTNVGRQNYLFQNQAKNTGQLKFKDVTTQAGIAGAGVANSILWWDYNSDGLADIYVGNDFKIADQLFRNNGDGTFTDVIQQAFPHTTWFSMGSEAGDINNDGRLDLFVSDMAGTTHYRSKVTMGEMSVHTDFMKTARPPQLMRNALLVNTGTPRFLEAAYLAGLAKSDWSWAVKLADFDNDGRLDCFISNGAARMFNHSDRNFTDEQRVGKTQWDLWEDSEPRREQNLAFRNTGDLHFENVSERWGLAKQGMSYATAYGDLDRDGDLDLVVANLDEPISIYRNTSSDGNLVSVRLVGTTSNRGAVGATVRITTAEGQQIRQLSPSMGFLSCNEPVLHFGLGTAGHIQTLTVSWPNGGEQEFKDLGVNLEYTITETAPQASAPEVFAMPWFTPSRVFPALQHTENEYDDYARQPLLPYAHSQLGPGLSVSDVDGDGDLDVYHGRAKGHKRAVYNNMGKGRLGLNTQLKADDEYEDMASLFFDADGDGHPDLYVASGSVEGTDHDATLHDRLYLNDRRGKFVAAPAGSLPPTPASTSVVCAADFDRDGDLDLFTGGRVVPGKYPITPMSSLLVNESRPGKPQFTNRTALLAKDLAKTGLVTSAVWSDADQDGWLDLLVTHEWGPVKLFRNERVGKQRGLVDRTRDAGLQTRLGWWNGIAASDLDNDGDMDYVVTNFGLNTQYKASDQKPELLYYGEFDASGTPRILEAKFEGSKCFPRRGLSCSSHAMPFVREKVKTFHNFGTATLEDIYTKDKLTDAIQLSANTLESGVLINTGKPSGGAGQGTPQFRFQALPRLAQISPAFGVVVTDFDADGIADIFLAQNFFSPQVETGRMDSGASLVLQGRGVNAQGELEFKPLWPRESGILIAGDAKACCVADFTEDGWPDLLVTVNNGPIEAYEFRPPANRKPFDVQLKGPAGNPTCIGARVTTEFDDGRQQTAEVTAGGGYLSQSSSRLWFGAGIATATRLTVRWPNGKTNRYGVKAGRTRVTINQPTNRTRAF